MTATGIKLLPAEAAYAHLAQFAKSDRVNVGGRCFDGASGIVTTPQRHDYSHILRSDLIVGAADGTFEMTIRVSDLLSGRYTIERAA